MRLKRLNRRVGKKAGIDLSFGFIFSIILIIAIIGTSIYAITYFLNLQRCTQVSLFYQAFQDRVDDAWNSEITRERFVSTLPGNIEAVCFRDENAEGTGEEHEALRDYFRIGGNMFIYPPEHTCNQIQRTIDHVDLSELGWHCFTVQNKEVAIPLEKTSFDSLVRVTR